MYSILEFFSFDDLQDLFFIMEAFSTAFTSSLNIRSLIIFCCFLRRENSIL